MQVLQKVLMHRKTEEWETADYNSSIYHRFQLNKLDTEYQTVADYFENIEISCIERVQHPFALGRYILRKEQLTVRDGSVNERKFFHPLMVSDIPVAIDYNLDVRRFKNAIAKSDRKPVFYSTASSAVEQFSSSSSQDRAIIVVDAIFNSCYENTAEFDTEYCPIYVVFINGEEKV